MSKQKASHIFFEPLEPKLLLSADPFGVADAAFDLTADVPSGVDQLELVDLDQKPSENSLTDYLSATGSPENLTLIDTVTTPESSSNVQLIIVDAAIENSQGLVDDLLSSASNSDSSYTVLYLNTGQSGVEQISSFLNSGQQYDALHILSHGNEDLIKLGTDQISSTNISLFESGFLSWKSGLSDSANILLYACDVAATTSGQELINSISEFTGLSVAASTDTTTSNQISNSDWDLEYSAGVITTQALKDSGWHWSGNLSWPGEGVLVATGSAVSAPGANGLAAWASGELVHIGGLGLGETTGGSLSSFYNTDNALSLSGDPTIDGLHFVQSTITLGSGSTSFTLLPGDVLVSTVGQELFAASQFGSGGLAQPNDVVLIRPDIPGDYTDISVKILLDDPLGENIGDFAIAETTVNVGAYTVTHGDFIFLSKNNQDVSAGTINADLTSITNTNRLFDGSKWGVDSNSLSGVDMISQSVSFGTETLSPGQFVVSFNTTQTNLGNDNVNAQSNDMLLISTTDNSGDVQAALIFDGSDIDLDTSSESPSAFSFIYPVTNSPAFGSPTISGTTQVGSTLTADASGISDTDGVTNEFFQWQRSVDGSTWFDITDETGTTYELTAADDDQYIRVNVSFVDGYGNSEGPLSSSATSQIIGPNDEPVASANDLNATHFEGAGSVALYSDAAVDTIESNQNIIAFGMSITNLADGAAEQLIIDGSTISLVDGESGSTTDSGFSYSVSYNAGSASIVFAAGSISSTAMEGLINSIRYQNTSLNPTESLRTVVITKLQDSGGTLLGGDDISAPDITATIVVKGVNSPPSGLPSVSGLMEEGQILTANVSTISDPEGITSGFIYQWQRSVDGSSGWTDISGETASSYLTTQNDSSQYVRVVVSYSDDGGSAEGPLSSTGHFISNVNDTPSGLVTIVGDGNPAEGEVLTVSDTLADQDGMGAVTYIWQRNGIDTGVTGASYTLTAADIGQSIQVEARYTDGFGTDEFVLSNVINNISNTNQAPAGSVTIVTDGSPVEGETISVTDALTDPDGVGTITYVWQRNGVDTGITGTSYTLSSDDIGQSIQVEARYTDGFGTSEAVFSNVVDNISNTNDAPTGNVLIASDGTPAEGEILTVSNTLADLDGMGPVTYVWFRDGADTGITGASYTLTTVDIGTDIQVEARYTDGFDTQEAVLSNIISNISNTNHLPSGLVTITSDGSPSEGETLIVSDTLADPDGIGPITYVWQRNGVDTGVTGTSYTITSDDIGQSIQVEARYTDGFGTDETVLSNVISNISNTNQAPNGTVIIATDGSPAEGEVLTVSDTLTDPDGMSPITYVWQRNGLDTGVTGTSYTLTADDIGQSIQVEARFIDGFGTEEAVLSNVIDNISNTNDAPSGGVTIISDGNPSEGEVLTVSDTLTDPDGMGAITYVWQRNGVDTGVTGTSYTLTSDDINQSIRVEARYTDGFGTDEAVLSNVIDNISNTNSAPSGNVTITTDGSPAEGEVLTVSDTLVDLDGLGNITYVWLRNGVDTAITGSSYTLTADDIGQSLQVEARYTDGLGARESILSNVINNISNTNDAPMGTVTIISDGSPGEGEVLTVANTLVDTDGLGAITYVWQRNGLDIGIGDEYILTSEDIGQSIQVEARYTDGFGTEEVVTSSPVIAAATPEITSMSPGLSSVDDSAVTQQATVEESSNEEVEEISNEEVEEISNDTSISDSIPKVTSRVDILTTIDRELPESSEVVEETSVNEVTDQPSTVTSLSFAIAREVALATGLKASWVELSDPLLLTYNSDYVEGLEQLTEQFENRTDLDAVLVGSGVAVSTSLSIGYVAWLIRSGVLFTSVLASMPAWKMIDPLPVLATLSSKEDEEEDSLEDIVQSQNDEQSKESPEESSRID